MLKKLFNFLLLSNGITPTDADREPQDKWARFREERERWEHEQKLKRAAPPEKDPVRQSAREESEHHHPE